MTAFEGHDSVAALLLKHGADANATTEDGTSVLNLAIQRRHNKLANLLEAAGSKEWV